MLHYPIILVQIHIPYFTTPRFRMIGQTGTYPVDRSPHPYTMRVAMAQWLKMQKQFTSARYFKVSKRKCVYSYMKHTAFNIVQIFWKNICRSYMTQRSPIFTILLKHRRTTGFLSWAFHTLNSWLPWKKFSSVCIIWLCFILFPPALNSYKSL